MNANNDTKINLPIYPHRTSITPLSVPIHRSLDNKNDPFFKNGENILLLHPNYLLIPFLFY